MRPDRWLLAVLLAGAAVRLYGLGARSLSYDEAQQFWAAQGNVLVSNREITLDPPGFAWLLHLAAAAGRDETWLRILPCLFGVLAIAAVHRLAMAATADLFTARAAALFIALAPYPIRYAQSLRVYSAAIFFSAALAAVFLDMLQEREPPRWGRVALLAGLTAAALLTLYGNVWLAGMLALVLAARRLRGGTPAWRRAAIGLAGGAVLALPWYALSLPVQMTRGTPASFYEDKFLPAGFLPAARFLALGTRDLFAFFSYVRPWTGLLFGALAILGMARLRGRRAGAILALVFAGVLAAAAAASAARLYPYGGTRQMLFAAPLFYVLAAAGVAALRPRWHGLPAGLILVAIAAGSVIFIHRYHAAPGGQEMRPVVRALEGALRPGDRILVNKDALPQFRFYYRGDPGRVVAGRETVIRNYLAEINEVLAAEPGARWWLVFSHGWSAGRRDELRGVDPRFAAGARFEAHRAGAYLFEPRPAPAGGAGGIGGGPPP